MKRLIYFLVLIVASHLDAALTVTSRGTQAFAATSTSIAFVPSSTIQAGTLGVLELVSPNSGTNGNTKIWTAATITDSVGNTWTRRLDTVYDPSTASQGAETAVYTGVITTQVTTSDNVTITGISPSTLNKLASMWEVSGANGTPTYVTSGGPDLATTGQGTTTVQMTTGSITSGDVVFCWLGIKDTTALSVTDSDTTNGSWVAGGGIITGTAYRLFQQYKITTGTGTQSWDNTLGAAASWQTAWMEIAEAVSGSSNSATNGFLLWGSP